MDILERSRRVKGFMEGIPNQSWSSEPKVCNCSEPSIYDKDMLESAYIL
ncbi:MAG TPA: hypothetical protein VHQ24_12790 [Lachnospiraceae bacterium]|nr:hypothetical protein [Lachnospiraceae bacterium]